MSEVNYRRLQDKRMSLHDAVQALVKDECRISFGGMGSISPLAVGHEIIRQGMKNLTVIGDSPSDIVDLLIGTGQVRKLEIAWIGYGIPGQAVNFMRAIQEEVPHKVELEEYTNYTIGLRLLAGAMDVPFLPTRSTLGSDISKYNTRIKIQNDPYTGQPIALVPSADLDVAVIHAQYADQHGNCQIYGHNSSSKIMARAAKHTIVTCEKIVSNDWIRKAPDLTAIPQYCVDAVVEVPFGCHPHNCAYMYEFDIPYISDLLKTFKTREGFLEWVDKNIMQVPDWETHLDMVGRDRLQALVDSDKKMLYKIPYKGV